VSVVGVGKLGKSRHRVNTESAPTIERGLMYVYGGVWRDGAMGRKRDGEEKFQLSSHHIHLKFEKISHYARAGEQQEER